MTRALALIAAITIATISLALMIAGFVAQFF